MKTLLSLFFLLSLTACSRGPSHLPSVFELPTAVIGSAIENTLYSAKRQRVSRFVKQHYASLRTDIIQGGGETLEKALSLSGVKPNDKARVTQRLHNDKDLLFHHTENISDAFLYAFAALYPPNKKDKRINGFRYAQARTIIRQAIDQHFESMRVALQQGKYSPSLEKLTHRLHMNHPQKKQQFLQRLASHYEVIYLEPVVVSLMVSGST